MRNGTGNSTRSASGGAQDLLKQAEDGEAIYRQLAAKIERTDRDKFVAINLKTKAHVIAATRSEVMDRYEERFGSTPAYLRRIGTLDHGGNVRL